MIDFEAIGRLGGFGKKSIDNLQAAIEASKQQPLHRLIFALGIRFVGETTAKVLSNKVQDPFNSYDWIDHLNQDYKLKARYFFLVAETTGKYDRNILSKETAFQILLKRHADKYKLLHPVNILSGLPCHKHFGI